MATPNIRPLPEHLQEVAIKELNERPERLAEDLEALKDWAIKEPHLNVRLDDQLLVAFLRGCKFSLEKTKSKLDWFYTLKTKYPDYYTLQDPDVPHLQDLVKYGVGLPLPIPLNEIGARIIFCRFGIYPIDKYKIKDLLAIAFASYELQMRSDDTSVINGFIALVDVSKINAAYFAQFTPHLLKKTMGFFANAAPIRQTATHFINVPASFEKLYSMIKPTLTEKQRNRIFLHGNNLETLYAHIPQKYLPKEFGGENDCIDELEKSTFQLFLDHRDYFKEDVKYRNNEELRVGQQPDYESLFGMEGSFRKIAVD
ncbi:alpha-tocopherol transfer protein-like [Bactrocera dorsalis]|uniref:Alpha-tocopherol transfer protein-like n=1 Tax=Bactrocera dorsalis TaxID=27457 RepID=A0A034WLH2_BACDO|nr:alpha-tocopherol transfer protein-like [Bactrocera dorsalis]